MLFSLLLFLPFFSYFFPSSLSIYLSIYLSNFSDFFFPAFSSIFSFFLPRLCLSLNIVTKLRSIVKWIKLKRECIPLPRRFFSGGGTQRRLIRRETSFPANQIPYSELFGFWYWKYLQILKAPRMWHHIWWLSKNPRLYKIWFAYRHETRSYQYLGDS